MEAYGYFPPAQTVYGAIIAFNFFQIAEMCFRNENRWTTSFLIWSIGHFAAATIALAFFEPPPIVIIVLGYIWALSFGVPAVLVMCRRNVALREASEAVEQDHAGYDQAWNPIKDSEEASLRKLAQCVGQHPCKRREQRRGDLRTLYRDARVLNDWYQEVVHSWAKECGAEHRRAPLKSIQRTLEKIYRSYFGKVPPILDLVRSSIVVDTVDGARQVLELVLHDAEVYTIKNRFDLDYDGRDTAGYRDMNLQIGFSEMSETDFEGFVLELQIHLRPVIEMKTDFGHRRYIALRNLRGD
jgi:hypothetical protein